MKFVYTGNPMEKGEGAESIVMKDAVTGARFMFLKDGEPVDVGEIVDDKEAAKLGNFSLALKLQGNSHFRKIEDAPAVAPEPEEEEHPKRRRSKLDEV